MEEHNDEQYEVSDETAEDLAFLAHHKIDTLVEVLIEKGVITEEALRKKSEELSLTDEDSDEVEE